MIEILVIGFIFYFLLKKSNKKVEKVYDVNGDLINKGSGNGFFTFIGILLKIIGIIIFLGGSFCAVVCSGGIALIIVIPLFIMIIKSF